MEVEAQTRMYSQTLERRITRTYDPEHHPSVQRVSGPRRLQRDDWYISSLLVWKYSTHMRTFVLLHVVATNIVMEEQYAKIQKHTKWQNGYA